MNIHPVSAFELIILAIPCWKIGWLMQKGRFRGASPEQVIYFSAPSWLSFVCGRPLPNNKLAVTATVLQMGGVLSMGPIFVMLFIPETEWLSTYTLIFILSMGLLTGLVGITIDLIHNFSKK